MNKDERLERARAVYQLRKEHRRYVVNWRGGGSDQIYSGITGFNDLSTWLNITNGTLYNYLCRGRGVFRVKRPNPVTGLEDIATITRIDPPAKPKKPRGRPRTRFPIAEEFVFNPSKGSSKIP